MSNARFKFPNGSIIEYKTPFLHRKGRAFSIKGVVVYKDIWGVLKSTPDYVFEKKFDVMGHHPYGNYKVNEAEAIELAVVFVKRFSQFSATYKDVDSFVAALYRTAKVNQ